MHTFSWAVMPHQGSFLESDVPVAAYLFNSPLHGTFTLYSTKIHSKPLAVRSIPQENVQYPLLQARAPFVVEGAPNIILETVKRGEDDDHKSGPTTVVLRLYEAFGGHVKANLRVASHIPVSKACITNLLEDETKQLRLFSGHEDTTSLKLDFHGFEVKTVKLWIGPPSTAGVGRYAYHTPPVAPKQY